MKNQYVDADKLISALKSKWNQDHPEYDDTSGSMTFAEIIEFIRKFAEEH